MDGGDAGHIDNTAEAVSDQTEPVDDSEGRCRLQATGPLSIDKIVGVEVDGDGDRMRR